MTSLLSQGKDYFDLVKSIGEAKSKQEEDRIVAEEVVYLKKAINQTSISKKKMKELVIRAIYVEMLGQDASYAYIRAVELCASTSVSQKKVGYLAASLCLSPDHEFRFMLVNQIQRDMKSSNMLEIAAALTAVCKIVTEDMIPAVIGDVLNLLKHDMDYVRKKAIGALHRFYQMDKQSVLDHADKIRRALCDKDPSVMSATLPLFFCMIQDDPTQFKDLVPSFVVILKQIIEHRLPRDYDYHRIPSPWIQMGLLKVLGLLGRGDKAASEGMYEIIADCMKRADTGINVGYAIVYETINTVTTIYPNTTLMDAAASAISRFIRSDSHNLKYIGIKGLASIVKDHPQYAADHQLAVIDCLEDPDETLKRKTLDLLFRMTNGVNVEFIVDKLLTFLASSGDDHFRSDLVNQITQCAERFAPSNTWYVQTIIRVFQLAGDKVKLAVAQTLTQLIAEGAEIEDDDEDISGAKDDELRSEAVEHFLDLIGKPKLPPILAQTMAWVLGEYGYLSVSCGKEAIMENLCQLAHDAVEPETKAAVITALSKLIAQSGTCPSKVLQMIQFYAQSKCLDLQQRCIEVLALLKHSDTMADVLPVDASCEDIDVDETLSFLQNFVQQALNNGARRYEVPASFLNEDEESSKKTTLKITPYAMPTIPVATPSAGIVHSLPSAASAPAGPTPLGPAIGNRQAAPLTINTAQGNQLINTRGAAQVWGKKPEPPPPAPEPVYVPTAAPEPVVAPSPTAPQLHGVSGGMWGASAAPTAATHVAPTAPVEPARPRELTEKEKMAAALFGGMGGKPSTTGVGAAAANRRKSALGGSAPPSAAPSANNSPAPAADLFSGMSSAAPVAPLPPAYATGAPAMELLDMLSDEPAYGTPAPPVPIQHIPVPAPQPVPVQNHNHFGGGLLDLGMAPAAPVMPVTPPPAPAAPVNLISDVFGGMDLSGGGSTMSANVDSGMRPLMINTQEYGRRWGMSPVDAKTTVPCSHLSRLDLDTIRRSMPAHFHHVESIPNTLESIYAATVTTIGAVVLVHVKLQPARRAVDVTVKSTALEVCQREASVINLAISSFRG